MKFQRVTQAVSLALFVGLFFLTVHPWSEGLAVDFFLRLDPVIGVGSVLATRTFSLSLIPGFVVLLSAFFVGRVFCGHICPMGTTLDVLQSSLKLERKKSVKSNSYESTGQYRRWKYAILAVILSAALGGVSLVFVGSPLSLVTRLYALAFHPVLLLVSDSGLAWVAPLIDRVARTELAYLTIGNRVFATNVFVAALFAAITALAFISPRFWCRNLCPAGALFGLFSRSPLLRRQVSDACTHCGRCVRECPTGAISEEPEKTAHEECIVCLQCVGTCPVSAISFRAGGPRAETAIPRPDFARRGILLAAGSGLITSALVRTGMYQPAALGRERPLRVAELIRPPGALPEPEFLTRCVRCGECMKVCPTNTLQPIWLEAGLEGIFSPVVVPRLAACAVGCTACGTVCPTEAIRELTLVEKNHAKLGTAWIAREYCLAWEQDKKCLVCDEMCPYKAISLKSVPDRTNAVPFVQANKCAGCGWCESKCPVEGASAIRVSIIGEIRLKEGSYVEKAQDYGLDLKTRPSTQQGIVPDPYSPGHRSPGDLPGSESDPGNSELPPGFSSK
jgi:MauM/NapG family ferredoxin protein